MTVIPFPGVLSQVSETARLCAPKLISSNQSPNQGPWEVIRSWAQSLRECLCDLIKETPLPRKAPFPSAKGCIDQVAVDEPANEPSQNQTHQASVLDISGPGYEK